MAFSRISEPVHQSITAATSSWVITPTANTTAGNMLFVGVEGRNSGVTGITVTDSTGANTWTTHVVSSYGAANRFNAIASCVLTQAILTSGTITIASNASMGASVCALAEEFSGATRTSYVDQTGSVQLAGGTGNTFSSTGNIAVSNELVVVFIGLSVTSGTITNGTNYTTFPSAPTTSGAAAGDTSIAGQFRTGPISGSPVASPYTASSSVGQVGVMVTVKPAVAPVNTVAPVASGLTAIGSTLTSTNGTWTNDGTAAFTYQWQRAGSNIAAATGSTYVLVSADAGNAISCVVTNTDAWGATSASSNSITADSSSDTAQNSGSAAPFVLFISGAY